MHILVLTHAHTHLHMHAHNRMRRHAQPGTRTHNFMPCLCTGGIGLVQGDAGHRHPSRATVFSGVIWGRYPDGGWACCPLLGYSKQTLPLVQQLGGPMGCRSWDAQTRMHTHLHTHTHTRTNTHTAQTHGPAQAPKPSRQVLPGVCACAYGPQLEHWRDSGLPQSKNAVENALIMQQSPQWKLLIDPQVRSAAPPERRRSPRGCRLPCLHTRAAAFCIIGSPHRCALLCIDMGQARLRICVQVGAQPSIVIVPSHA